MTHAQAAEQGATPGVIVVDRIASGEFRVTASGLWTPDYADTHFGRLKRTLAAARGSHGVHVLVDMREAAVQSAATAERVRYWTGSIYDACDRVAILVASSLLRMQVRRVTVIATHELFTSEPEAVAWLRSDAAAGRAGTAS